MNARGDRSCPHGNSTHNSTRAVINSKVAVGILVKIFASRSLGAKGRENERDGEEERGERAIRILLYRVWGDVTVSTVHVNKYLYVTSAITDGWRSSYSVCS